MSNMKLKITVAAVVLCGAIGYLAFAGAESSWVYYVEVDEFLAEPDFQSRRVRICGIAAEEGLQCEPANLRATFDVKGIEGSVPVVYTGVIPQQFKAGSQVVLEGKLDENGVFQANVLLTKCASKYQAEDHAKRLGGAS